jgi:S-adenosylmethionine decarboxylase|eukprot:733045_1
MEDIHDEHPLAESIHSDFVYCSSEDGEKPQQSQQPIPSIVNPNANDVLQIDCDNKDEDPNTIQILDNDHNIHNDTTENQAVSDDESGEVDREYTGQFEGPEKTLEVLFRPRFQPSSPTSPIGPIGGKAGLRTLPRNDLDHICKRARCTILSTVSNQYLDAYVLSESSLFVYNYMIVLKTCGTTTLLRCLALLIELARSKLNLELDWVGYSRKNFNFPDDQQFPHGSFTQELEYLYSHKNLCDKLNGNGYTLGPITDDHWFVFVADKTIRSQMDLDNDRVLNIMMFDIDADIGNIFYYDKYQNKDLNETEAEEVKRISFEQTKAAGIDALCPGALFDPRAFEPCGYSMNAILYKSYYTMHITPEEGSSYASFETNQKLASYTSLINNVVRTFKPKKFVMTLMADEGGLKEMNKNGNVFMDHAHGSSKIIVPNVGKNPVDMKKNIIYKRTNLASITVEDDCVCMMGNWTIEQDPRDENVRRSRGLTFA